MASLTPTDFVNKLQLQVTTACDEPFFSIFYVFAYSAHCSSMPYSAQNSAGRFGRTRILKVFCTMKNNGCD